MLDLFTSQPRLAVGAVVGTVLGFAGALALRSIYPTLSVALGALVVATALGVGVVVGAIWEGKRS